MKALLISTYNAGGAGLATCRLHRGLLDIGVASQVLVQTKKRNDRAMIAPKTKVGKGIASLRQTLSGLPLHLYPQREDAMFSVPWLPSAIAPQVNQLNPDVINLHWISHGYLQIETIARFNKPIVWTLHDMWPFTGGCHYSQGCDRYMASCGTCPQLHSDKRWDLSRWIWQRKANIWKNLDLTIVTPSYWLAECASASSLFRNLRIEVIPNGLDTQRYKPMSRQLAREWLNLPQDKQLVLFGSANVNDRRKGWDLLQQALGSLSQSIWRDRIELIVFGFSELNIETDLGFKSYYLGELNDDVSLALVYAASDVFVTPATQDNLPNTVMEAIACATPCVAFKIGGMPDMIEHQQNGYLAQPFNVEDLAQGIVWVLENQERHQKLCECAEQKAKAEFSIERQARRYQSLFTELIDSTPKT